MANVALLRVVEDVERILEKVRGDLNDFYVPLKACSIHALRPGCNGSPKRVDIMVLTKYPLAKDKLGMLRQLAQESGCSMAAWALICARGPYECTTKATDLREEWQEVEEREGHDQPMTVMHSQHLPWSDWTRDAIGALRPRVLLIMLYHDKDTTFSDIWVRMPIKYADAIVHTDYEDGWAAAETKLRQNYLFGSKRMTDGSLDPVAIITGADAAASSIVASKRKIVDEGPPPEVCDGGNLNYAAEDKAPEITASKAVQAKAAKVGSKQRARADMHPPPWKTPKLDTFFRPKT